MPWCLTFSEQVHKEPLDPLQQIVGITTRKNTCTKTAPPALSSLALPLIPLTAADYFSISAHVHFPLQHSDLAH
jgi:hypothetical protein